MLELLLIGQAGSGRLFVLVECNGRLAGSLSGVPYCGSGGPLLGAGFLYGSGRVKLATIRKPAWSR